jgi:4-diphosphocytidyl-2-C-methyl-D-erythritol kinase
MAEMSARASVAAKINLALVVGPRRSDGLHELVSVVQRIDLCDRLELAPGGSLRVLGFAEDTLVAAALTELAAAARVEPSWEVRLTKQIPVGAGLGGGSADAAAALALANRTLATPLDREQLLRMAASIGSDVPFFLEPGPKLVEGAGERLTPLELPQDFWVLLARDPRETKASTGAIYARFDELDGPAGFEGRRAQLASALARVRRPRDLADLPANDLGRCSGDASLRQLLLAAGAFRADLSGAGPVTYGLFHHRAQAEAAAASLPRGTRAKIVAPVW